MGWACIAAWLQVPIDVAGSPALVLCLVGLGLRHAWLPAPCCNDNNNNFAVYAAQRAAVWLWCLLQDFVCLKVVPGEWLGVVPPDHPFIGVLNIDEGMRLNLPSELRLPDDLN